jgi:hypothetical protein
MLTETIYFEANELITTPCVRIVIHLEEMQPHVTLLSRSRIKNTPERG